MNSFDQLKLDIITKVSMGRLSIKEASVILNKSQRTVERYLSNFRSAGAKFVKHRNCFKPPVNKIPHCLEAKVKHLIQTKYYDFNVLHLQEYLSTYENIIVKRETLRKWSHSIHMVKKKKRRSPRARFRRQRMSQRGLLLQMDGSTHHWFGSQKSCLIAVIDDASSELLWGEFFHSEDTISCLEVLKKIVKKFGLFKVLYVDRAGIFGGPKRCEFAQVQRAMEELGIQIIFANSAQAKGRIERSFNTLQDRLIPELRIRNIYSYPKANEYLQNHFIPGYWNNKLAVLPSNPLDAFTAINADYPIDEIFCLKEYRKINLDHTISYKADIYLLNSPYKHSIARAEIEIRTYLDFTVKFYYAGQAIEAKKIAPLSASKAA